MALYVGIDFGTSGARAIAIDATGQTHAEGSYRFETVDDSQLPQLWQDALFDLIGDLIGQISIRERQRIAAIALDGTSSTVLLCDRQGQPLTAPLLYNDARSVAEAKALEAIAPAGHVVLSPSSSLTKLLWWRQRPEFSQAAYLMHQADWLAFQLHGQPGISDYHNCLKLGYDPASEAYPAWMAAIPQVPALLPKVLAPGTPVGPVLPMIADQLGLPPSCCVCAGTTDSIAAFLASGADAPGEAVTSLGSTLVVKLLSRTRVDHSRYGIYSHRLGDLWLVGGASNAGGAVLRQFFSDVELAELSQRINPKVASPLDYYPLPKPGERFPINDPHLPPRLDPRPSDPVEFLHGILESLARIEAQGYQLLAAQGATPLTLVYTAGGGAVNATWSALRQRHLRVPVVRSPQTEAAYGSARLAAQGVHLESLNARSQDWLS